MVARKLLATAVVLVTSVMGAAACGNGGSCGCDPENPFAGGEIDYGCGRRF